MQLSVDWVPRAPGLGRSQSRYLKRHRILLRAMPLMRRGNHSGRMMPGESAQADSEAAEHLREGRYFQRAGPKRVRRSEKWG